MIYENYCSFEVSKLISTKKEIFDAEWDYWYSEYGERCCCPSIISIECPCPTHQTAVNWLKEKYDIWIYSYPSCIKNGEWEGKACWIKKNKQIMFNNQSSIFANEPSEVIEKILLYILKNIIK